MIDSNQLPDMDTQKLTDIVNQSGFPLQIGVASLIERTKDQHGWKVLFMEHSWKNELDNDKGFVDLVLEDRHRFSVMIVECKRVLDSSWIFLNPDPTAKKRRHAKAWLTRHAGDCFKHLNWTDLTIDPDSFESEYCVVFGQDAKSKPMLERVAAELVSATEAIALEEKDYQAQRRDTWRVYFSVIVTTAKLRMCTFNPDKISIADGKIVDPQFTDVPYIRFRKQLSTRAPAVPLNVIDGFNDFVRAKEHTVFVVQSESVPEFLSTFEVDNQKLAPFE